MQNFISFLGSFCQQPQGNGNQRETHPNEVQEVRKDLSVLLSNQAILQSHQKENQFGDMDA